MGRCPSVFGALHTPALPSYQNVVFLNGNIFTSKVQIICEIEIWKELIQIKKKELKKPIYFDKIALLFAYILESKCRLKLLLQ